MNQDKQASRTPERTPVRESTKWYREALTGAPDARNIPKLHHELADKYSHPWVPRERFLQAMGHLEEAHKRLMWVKKFRDKFASLSPYRVIPLMIKESLMDPSARSKSNALGYFQLKSDAATDAKAILKNFWINKEYNPENPVDNCILWLLFYDDTDSRLTDKMSMTYPQEYVLLAYNAWVERAGDLIQAFQNEKKEKWIPNWDAFALWLSGKIEKSPKPKIEFSKQYNISFRNWFSGDYADDATLINIDSSTKIKKSKIQEVINYVEKIRAIQSTEQKKWEPPKATPQPTGTITPQAIPTPPPRTSWEQRKPEIQKTSWPEPYDEARDEFHGSWVVDSTRYRIAKLTGENKEYQQILAQKGDGVMSLLKKAGINPTKEIISEFYTINFLDSQKSILWEKGKVFDERTLWDADAIQIGAYYLVPKKPEGNTLPPWTNSWASGPKPPEQWASGPRQKPTVSEDREKERLSRDFYKWLETIPVKNESLKGKLFVLDPGHGWWDPWAVPVVYGKDGNPVPYVMSDISGAPGKEKVVANGQWDKALRVVEARVVMDVAYRLAKHLRENGAEVKITHYFQKGIDDSQITESSQLTAPWLMDEFEYYDTWGNGSKEKFIEQSKAWLHGRVKVRNKMMEGKDPKKTYFISLHADRANKPDKMAMNILHENGNTEQRSFAYQLAASIGKVRDMPVTAWTRTKPIHVLKEKSWARSQNVLIELGNMDNANTAYALRSPKTRQEYADGIFRWIHSHAHQ